MIQAQSQVQSWAYSSSCQLESDHCFAAEGAGCLLQHVHLVCTDRLGALRAQRVHAVTDLQASQGRAGGGGRGGRGGGDQKGGVGWGDVR